MDRIKTALEDHEIKELYDIRVENWRLVPPASSKPQDTALFAVDLDDFEESYLVWVGDAPEPQVYTFFGAGVKRFLDLGRYLEYLVGDRKEDDNEPACLRRRAISISSSTNRFSGCSRERLSQVCELRKN